MPPHRHSSSKTHTHPPMCMTSLLCVCLFRAVPVFDVRTDCVHVLCPSELRASIEAARADVEAQRAAYQ